MDFVKKIDRNLHDAIKLVVLNKEKYVHNPSKDFTRKRKFPMEDVITQIHSMNGGTLKKEMYDLSKTKNMKLTPSAFIQQRSKISSVAFKEIFNQFNNSCVLSKKYRGYRLFAVDGSDISCPCNPKSKYFLVTSQQPKDIIRFTQMPFMIF